LPAAKIGGATNRGMTTAGRGCRVPQVSPTRPVECVRAPRGACPPLKLFHKNPKLAETIWSIAGYIPRVGLP
jgi:hypothetical protein